MAEVIRMPKMSDTMSEGVIASWLKKVGEEVQSGDILAEVETDKATMELESYEDGTLLYIGIPEKQSVPVDGVIAIIGEKGEDITALVEEIKNGGGDSNTESEPSNEETKETNEEAIDTSNINATAILMPKMSDTMTEGHLSAWHKKVGDEVSSGDVLADVETDKATMELESYDDGVLLHIAIEAGQSVPVDGVIAVIGEKGADYETLLKAQAQKKGSSSNSETKTESKEETVEEVKSETPTNNTSNERIFASPLAKKIAKEKGINLSQVNGSGENGRIIKKDVENFTPAAVSPIEETASVTKSEKPATIELPTIVAEEKYKETPVSQMRKVISKRLSESKFTAPHFYVTVEINMDNAIAARKVLNETSPVKISFNDIVVKATAAALRKHPSINSSWRGDVIRENGHIHIGVAMAIPDGLIVPVIRFADNKSLSHISAEVKDFAVKAKKKELQPKDWEGNTFTISNLGMFGVDEFTGIINSPDAAILAVGGIQEKPVVKNGQIVPGNLMKVTLSSDHRVIDGAEAASFLNTLKTFVENPIKLLI